MCIGLSTLLVAAGWKAQCVLLDSETAADAMFLFIFRFCHVFFLQNLLWVAEAAVFQSGEKRGEIFFILYFFYFVCV